MKKSLPERTHQLIDQHLRRTHTWLDRTLGAPTATERRRQQREDFRRMTERANEFPAHDPPA